MSANCKLRLSSFFSSIDVSGVEGMLSMNDER